MSNWTHINFCVRGEFTKKELEKLFGKPVLDCYSKYKFPYDSKEYKEREKLIEKLYNQCKLPFGEEPLNYKLIKGNNRVQFDADILIIWGSLRWFEMSNANQYKQIEDIVKNILAQFPYSVRQLTMQAYDEFSKKTYIWSSVFNSEPILTILEKKQNARTRKKERKMLKIKDNVDLSELLKFGFKKANEYAYGYYFKNFYVGFRIAICKPNYEHKDREIFIDTIEELYDVIDEYNNTIFDLIKADMVEVVEDEQI